MHPARTICRSLTITLLAGVLAPAYAAGQEVPPGAAGVVIAPLANVRSGTEPKDAIVTQVLLAEEVRILEKRDYRYRIAAPAQGGVQGWVHQAALQLPRDNGAGYFRPGREWIVVAAPRTRALVLDRQGDHALSLYAGTRLPVLEKSGRGYTVQFPDRRTTAVIPSADALPFTPGAALLDGPAPRDLAALARRFIGVRHFRGGLTVQGMDTRGLILTVYRVHGMDLDLDREALKARSLTVQKKDLAPGDLLSFYGEGLGLYLGNGKFLHAPNKTTVQVSGIHDPRYARSFQQGLRLLGADPAARKRPLEMTADEIMTAQVQAAGLPLGKRIAYWAGRFIGTPYDTDPLGLYVRSRRIVADEAVDCMYHTFRSVELARAATPGEAIEEAKRLRFFVEGIVTDGLVRNYEGRFEYGEDMVFSGKWGRNITDELGATAVIPGSRGREQVIILPKSTLATRAVQQRLRDGDIIFWVKDPAKRVVGEIVAHLAVVRVRDGAVQVIHASGSKSRWNTPNGGAVKEAPLAEYLRESRFIGAFVTRFEE